MRDSTSFRISCIDLHRERRERYPKDGRWYQTWLDEKNNENIQQEVFTEVILRKKKKKETLCPEERKNN